MSTSDSEGQAPLTRKQLREIRLTGATPVITDDQAKAAQTPPTPPAPTPPRAADPVEVAPAPAPLDEDAVDLSASPLTRRQARAQERIRTASVPVVGAVPSDTDAEAAQTVEESSSADAGAVEPEIVSAVPVFAPVAATPSVDAASSAETEDSHDTELELEDSHDTELEVEDAVEVSDIEEPDEDASDDDASGEATPDVEADLVGLGVDIDAIEDAEGEEAERPTVNATFGQGVLSDEADNKIFTPSFDELIATGDSTGSHIASSALIFNPPAGEGSLSGPVASTGEMLITGSYDLPAGLGSQGHAKGTTDGKDIDAVLIDGELPPASSPTPIAASSAVSTIKPAGEVIRPPAPEKGNKLMITLAITAGGLALVLGTALIIAFSMNVF